MPWFKVDDNLAFHHKVVAAGNPALGLWVRAGSLCAQQLTDGFVPDHMILTIGTKAQAERLVKVGLWDRVKGGYSFHGWGERQPSKASVEAERAAAQERMRAYRAKKKGTSPEESSQVSGSRSGEQDRSFGVGSGEVRDSFGNPDPTHPSPDPSPDPSSSSADKSTAKPRKKPAKPLAADWRPTEEHLARCRDAGVDPALELAKFRAHAEANDRRQVNWNAAFTQWLLNARPSNVRPLPGSGPDPDAWMARRPK